MPRARVGGRHRKRRGGTLRRAGGRRRKGGQFGFLARLAIPAIIKLFKKKKKKRRLFLS